MKPATAKKREARERVRILSDVDLANRIAQLAIVVPDMSREFWFAKQEKRRRARARKAGRA